MTIASDNSKVRFLGDGSTTVFALGSTFVFFDSSELVVTLRVNATGVETVKTITTHYTVSGGSGATGTVTMLTAPAVGEALIIQRVMPLTQGVDLVNNTALDAEGVEDALDKLTLADQQLSEQQSRSIQVSPYYSEATFDPVIPLATPGAYLRVNTLGTGIEATTGDITYLFSTLLDYGATGDGVVDDTAAVQAALAAGGITWVPPGRYKTTLTALQLVGATFEGPGRILTVDSSTERDRANTCITMTAPPTTFITGGSIFSDFDGEFLSPYSTQVYVSGANTAGITTSGGGYIQPPQSAPFFTRALFTSGQNFNDYNNADRTGWAVHDIRLSHYGQADAACMSMFAFIGAVSDNADQWCQGQPAGVMWNGRVTASLDKQIINPVEYNLVDGGNDTVGKGLVINCDRDNHDEDEDQWWACYIGQSIGAEPAGSFLLPVGDWDVILDGSNATCANAIALKAGQKIHFNTDAAAEHKPCPQWITSEAVVADVTLRWNANRVYLAKTTATTGATPPTHSSGTVSDGTVDWLYLADNNFKTVAKAFTTPTYMQFASSVWELVYAGVQRLSVTATDIRFATRLLATAIATHVRSETTSQSLSAENSVVLIDATGPTSPTYTLPLAAAYATARAARLTLKRTGAGGTVTIQRASTDTIVDKSGASVTSFTLAANQCVELVGDGSSVWHILYIA